MRGAGLSLALVLLLTGCAPGEAARAANCPAFADVDRTAPPPHLNGDPAEERLDAIWRRWAGTTPEVGWRTTGPEATFRLSTDTGMTAEPRIWEIAGRRGPAGWEVHTRTALISTPMMTWSPWQPATLSSEATRRLDALLANPCLWEAPAFLDAEVKLKTGRYDSRPDGPSTLYDLTVGERRWGGWHLSWTVGEPGAIRNLLLAELFDQPEYPVDHIGPEGWLDAPTPAA